MGTVTNAALLFEQRNPRLYSTARVRIPAFVPRFLLFLCNSHIGEQGIVISVERGQNTKKMLYTVIFEKDGKASTDSYFEKDLEFL